MDKYTRMMVVITVALVAVSGAFAAAPTVDDVTLNDGSATTHWANGLTANYTISDADNDPLIPLYSVYEDGSKVDQQFYYNGYTQVYDDSNVLAEPRTANYNGTWYVWMRQSNGQDRRVYELSGDTWSSTSLTWPTFSVVALNQFSAENLYDVSTVNGTLYMAMNENIQYANSSKGVVVWQYNGTGWEINDSLSPVTGSNGTSSVAIAEWVDGSLIVYSVPTGWVQWNGSAWVDFASEPASMPSASVYDDLYYDGTDMWWLSRSGIRARPSCSTFVDNVVYRYDSNNNSFVSDPVLSEGEGDNQPCTGASVYWGQGLFKYADGRLSLVFAFADKFHSQGVQSFVTEGVEQQEVLYAQLTPDVQYTVEVSGYDLENESSKVNASVNATNTPPAALNLSINPIASNNSLVGDYTFYDADGDTESGTTTYWRVNGNITKTNDPVLLSSEYGVDDNVTWQVIPNDGAEAGSLNQTTLVDNVTLNSVSISPSSPTFNDDLVVTCDGSNTVNLSLTYIIDIYRNGRVIKTYYDDDGNVTYSSIAKTEEYFARCTVTDGYRSSSPANTTTVTVQYSSTDGTLANPHLISDYADFKSIPDEPNAHYILVDDVTVSPMAVTNDWARFDFENGSIDGRAYALYGLSRNAGASNYLGFIRFINATMKNVSIVSPTVSTSSASFYVAYAFVGGQYTMIQDVSIIEPSLFGRSSNTAIFNNMPDTGVFERVSVHRGSTLGGSNSGGFMRDPVVDMVDIAGYDFDSDRSILGSQPSSYILALITGATADIAWNPSNLDGSSELYFEDTASCTQYGDGYAFCHPLNSSELVQQASFPDFNFTTTWEMEEGVTYPYLKAVPFTREALGYDELAPYTDSFMMASTDIFGDYYIGLRPWYDADEVDAYCYVADINPSESLNVSWAVTKNNGTAVSSGSALAQPSDTNILIDTITAAETSLNDVYQVDCNVTDSSGLVSTSTEQYTVQGDPVDVSNLSCPAVTYPNENDDPSAAVMELNFSVWDPYEVWNNVVNMTDGSTVKVPTGCDYVVQDSTHRNYTCNFSVNYYNPYGDWDVHVLSDNSITPDSESTVCTIGQLIASQVDTDVITFSDAGPGLVDVRADQDVIVRNTGNSPVDLYMTAYDLKGSQNPSELLLASNFKAGGALGSAVQLANATQKDVNIGVAVGEGSAGNIGLWLSIPSDARIQDYVSVDSWKVVATG